MTNHRNTPKALIIACWLCQILLAVTLLWASAMKLFKPTGELAQMWPWVADNPALTKITGIVDLLGGIGIVLPSILRLKPALTIYTGYGIIALMIAASVFHISRGEAPQIGFNIFVGVVAGFIVWARSRKA